MTATQNDSSGQSIAGLSAQLIELQTQLAFQEEAISDLSDALAKQQRLLDAMHREWSAMKVLYESLQSGGDAADTATAQERPPHY